MIVLSRAERQCARFEEDLRAGARDEIGMLRIARTLKRLIEEMRLEVWQWARRTGLRREAAQAAASLAECEQDLRHVLLTHQSMEPQQMRFHLWRAVQNALGVLAVLALPVPA